MRPYLFFDAGGTLVFLSAGAFRREAERFSYYLDPEVFDAGLCKVNRRLDEYRRKGLRWQEALGNRHFFRLILDELGIAPEDAEAIKDALVAVNKERNLWSTTHPWVPDTLARLKAMGYGMSIISNTDGRVREQLADGGILGCFDQVFDSLLIGLAKPDPRIFAHSCDTLGLKPEECLYIGDSPAIDVLGANSFGMPAVLVDRGGQYEDLGALRIRTVQELPDLLRDNPDIYRAPGAFAFPLGSYKA